jgi:polysaccharide chain length determinant protein (PEP-CTERM system associated)
MTHTGGGAHGVRLALSIWRRRKWLMVVAFVLPLSAAVGLVSSLPNTYRASAVILVDRQQVPEAFVKSTVTSALETRLHSISQEILSRSRLEELIVQANLYGELRARVPMEVVVERMRRDIELDLRGVQRMSHDQKIVAFSIRYLGTDAHTVAEVANTLASYYLEANSRFREREASGTADFLERQLQDMKARLEQQEQRLSAFKARHIGETPQHIQENLTMLDRLNTQLKLNAERQTRVMERRETLARQIADAESMAYLGPEPAGPVSAGVTGARPESAAARLHRLRQELAELRTRFSDKYPDVVRLRAEIAELEKVVAEKPDTGDEPQAARSAVTARRRTAPQSEYVLRLRETVGELEAEIKALRVEEKRVQDDLALYQRRVANTPHREQEFQTLSRDYSTISDLYRTLLQRYEEAQLAETLEQRQKGEQFKVLERALPPSAPFAPDRSRLLLVGLLGAIGLAAGAVILVENLDTSFHSVDELRAATVTPVLVSIPRIVTAGDVKRQRWWFGMATGAVALGAVLLGGTGYLVAKGYVPMASRVVHSWLLRV